MDNHRISIEPRSGIYLLFYETLIAKGIYKQQLLRKFNDFESAEKAATFEKLIRHIDSDVILRDDSQKNKMIRGPITLKGSEHVRPS